MEKLKLSMLADDVEVSIEESSTVYTVAELKSEILDLGEPHHESSNWYTIKRQAWVPDAETMIDTYLENESCDLYEDAYERLSDEVSQEDINKIQAVLDQVFHNNPMCDYWTYEKPVEIDIFPKTEKQKALETLNSMSIIDTDSDGEVMIYIYVENSQENREKLISLGFTDDYISSALYDYNENSDAIDLNHFAWDYAEWFDGEKFLEHAPQ